LFTVPAHPQASQDAALSGARQPARLGGRGDDAGHLDVLDQLYVPSIAAAARRWITPFRQAFPDVTMTPRRPRQSSNRVGGAEAVAIQQPGAEAPSRRPRIDAAHDGRVRTWAFQCPRDQTGGVGTAVTFVRARSGGVWACASAAVLPISRSAHWQAREHER